MAVINLIDLKNKIVLKSEKSVGADYCCILHSIEVILFFKVGKFNIRIWFLLLLFY